MKKPLSKAEYTTSLPKKRSGTCVIFQNESNELLILDPNYREEWTIPGGTVDADESPKAAALREVKEEIGLEIKDLDFLFVEYVATRGESLEGLEFVFYGGVLSDDQVTNIVLEEDEFHGHKFLNVEKALPKLRKSVRRRVTSGLKVLETQKPFYSEIYEQR